MLLLYDLDVPLLLLDAMLLLLEERALFVRYLVEEPLEFTFDRPLNAVLLVLFARLFLP